MTLFEFLNRISFFSILAWAFYFIAVICAIILTTVSTPLARKYRRTLIAVGSSTLLLGTISWSTPFLIRKINPDQSRLTAIDQLTPTEWIEPINNPATELPVDEIAWSKQLPYQFKFKIQFKEEFSKSIAIEGETLVILDQSGSLHGLNAYTGLNHWSIPLHIYRYLGSIRTEKKLYVIDRTSFDALRISCLDLQYPSLLWQRTIPNAREGAITYDLDSQSVLVSAGSSGLWSLKAKTGEIHWKRPEIYTKTKAIPSQKHILVFEPMITGRAGSWYFLDSTTGKTIQKNPHAFTEVQDFILDESAQTLPPFMIAKVDAQNYFFMNHLDLSQAWSHHSDSSIKLIQYLGQDRYLALYDTNLLELHSLKDDTLLWQKKLSLVNPKWMKVSPNLEWITLPEVSEGEVPGVSFYQVQTGDYQVAARTTEPILDLMFYGDWLYLFSENHLWALKK